MTAGPGRPLGFRRQARERILDLARAGSLAVPIAAEFPFERAPAAIAALMRPHAPGKFALTR